MPPKKKKKSKATKADKEKQKKEADEKRALEKEAARIRAAELEAQRLERERIEQEERDRIKAEEAKIREVQLADVRIVLDDFAKTTKNQKITEWEDCQWQHYLYQSTRPNPLILPQINAYLSNWRENENQDMEQILKEVHTCLSLIEEVELALLNCPDLDKKSEIIWRETHHNLQDLLKEKLDKATYDVLTEASDHLNRETFNMEYYVSDHEFNPPAENDDDQEDPVVAMNIWANLAKSPRYNGIEQKETGCKFILPRVLIVDECAVRMMRTLFDHVTQVRRSVEEEAPAAPTVEHKDSQVSGMESTLTETFTETDRKTSKASSDSRVETEGSTAVGSLTPSPTPNLPSSGKTSMSKSSLDTITIPKAKIPTPEAVAPPEPEEIDLTGFTILGGVIYFELFEVPPQPIQAGKWILTYVEHPRKLVIIPYKTTITPIRQPKPGLSPAEAAEFADSEIKRYEREISNAITVWIRLPKSVLYLDTPFPAFWYPEKEYWTSEGFFDIRFEEDDNSLFFKTNQFGIIGIALRRYCNLPLQTWELKPTATPNTVKLTLSGSLVIIEILIGEKGCQLLLVQYAERSWFRNLYKKWMPAQLLTRKLSSLGINMAPELGASDHVGLPPKDRETEDWLHMCMALLSPAFIFSWSRFNSVANMDQFVLKCCEIKKDLPQGSGALVLVTPERAVLLKCTEISQAFSDEGVDGMQFFGDVYHLLLSTATEESSKKIEENNAHFHHNVYSILSLCKPLSFS